jgi:hypothetical protein
MEDGLAYRIPEAAIISSHADVVYATAPKDERAY